MEPLFRYLRPVPASVHFAWLACIILTAGSIWGGTELQRRYKRLQLQKIILQRQQTAIRVPLPHKPRRAELEAARNWEGLRKELAFSWYPVFAALEHTDSPDIALLEFLPDKASGILILHGNARDIKALTTYLDMLANERAFENVYLSRQKKIQQAAQTFLMFEIRLRMR